MSGRLGHARRCPYEDNSEQVFFNNTFLTITAYNDHDSDDVFHVMKLNVFEEEISTATGRMGPFPLKI